MNQHYPPSVSGDSITTNDNAYPRSTCAAGMLLEHLLWAESERGLVAQSVADEVRAMVEEDERSLGFIEPAINGALKVQ